MKTAICAIIKDEHRFLKEWIDWHLNLGFDAIHLFEDKGSESHEEIVKDYDNVFLRRYETDDEVREILKKQGSARQVDLYNYFINQSKDVYDWVAFIDIDEFFIFDGYSLHELCEEFSDYSSVLIAWKMIGASGHISRPSCGVVEAYTEPHDIIPKERGWAHKSIVNISKATPYINPHRTTDFVNRDKKPVIDNIYKKVWVNHYFTKSWEDWCERIFKRGGTIKAHRILADFFECNPSMEHMRNELISAVSHIVPNGTYWLDKNRTLIAGGNVKKIMQLNAKQQKLIFDLGFHNGDTATYYLQRGCKVIGVECNEELVRGATEHFNSYIRKGSLIIENKCIYDKDNQYVDFYISKYKEWSSLYQKIAEREEESKKVLVESVTLATLIKKHGCPYYCKIDVEGADILALQSLKEIDEKPNYISCEVECLGKNEVVTDFPIVEELRNLGYNKFMLIDQSAHKDFRFDFYKHYNWKCYDEILRLLLDARTRHWDYGIWFDIYATK
jgi:FkbM family methyltransferase